MKRTALLRRTPLRAKSKKRQRQDVLRRKLVAQLLETYPWCQRCFVERAVDCHELKNRSQGGDPLDPTGIATLCRPCHIWVTEHPQAAHDEGWTRWSYEDINP
jgi:hypothetical protein